MSYQTVQEYNNYLVESHISVSIDEYFAAVAKMFYPTPEGLQDFTSLFLTCIKTPFEFCINQDEFVKYRISKNPRETAKLLLPFTDEVDYSLRDGKKYFVKPKVFKLCLMKAKNTGECITQYFQLEEMHLYYQQYITNALNAQIVNKNKEIEDRVEQVKSDLLVKNKELEAKIASAIPEGIENLKDYEDRSEFALVQNNKNPNEFKFLRGMRSYINVGLKKTFDGDYTIVKRDYNSNPVVLFHSIRNAYVELFREERQKIPRRGIKPEQRREMQAALVKIESNNTTITLVNGYPCEEFYKMVDKLYVSVYKNQSST
jgi:hypothetical protein